MAENPLFRQQQDLISPQPDTQLHPKRRLAEIIAARNEHLAADFDAKAAAILAHLEADYIITTEESELRRPVEDQGNGLGPIVLGRSVDSIINTFRRYLATPNSDGWEKAANVMYEMSRLAKLMPRKIPHYFAEYTINPDSKESDGSYYPDGRIESFENQTEPVILFAKQLAEQLAAEGNGEELPARFQDLVALYKQEQSGQQP